MRKTLVATQLNNLPIRLFLCIPCVIVSYVAFAFFFLLNLKITDNDSNHVFYSLKLPSICGLPISIAVVRPMMTLAKVTDMIACK